MFTRNESVVYGYIRDYYESDHEVSLRQHRLSTNLRALGALPSAMSFSYLHREMFSTPRVQRNLEDTQSYIIHFGASYLGVEYEWSHWMEQFEALLAKMYWVSACVHLEADTSGNHIFQWESGNDEHKPGDLIQSNELEWIREAV